MPATTNTIAHTSLHSALYSHWNSRPDNSLPTCYPHQQFDSTAQHAWYEYQMPVIESPPRRDIAPERHLLTIHLHLFHRQPANPHQVQQELEAAKTHLTHAIIPIRDLSDQALPIIGMIALHEPELRDFSSLSNQTAEHTLTHHVLSFTATAQAIATQTTG